MESETGGLSDCMTSLLQLCAPCQMAIRSSRVAQILGPQSSPQRNVPNRWSCALCTTIEISRKEREASLQGSAQWLHGGTRKITAKIKSLVATSDVTSVVPSPSVNGDYMQAMQSRSPQPPIGDIKDIILLSERAQHSQPHFELNPPLDSHSLHSARALGHQILRVVPSNQIDRGLVQAWISHCERNHGFCIQNHLERSNDIQELLLIDVIRKSIVRSSITARFFALSYIWGNVSQFLTKESDLAALQEDGSLQKYWEQIPTVIKDAIYFVETISEQYLWVDTLCIAQDSPDLHLNISRMDEIYNGAVCTLIAIDCKDASGTLHGVHPQTRQTPYVGLNGDLKIARKRSDLASVCSASVYERRAWTLQERILSRRCLYFTKEQLLFQCQTAIWSEDRYEHFRQSFGLGPSFNWTHDGLERSRSSALDTYTQLAQEYARRQLSYVTDRLNAFQGIIGALSKRKDYDFVCGLPTQVFSAALLWVSTTRAPQRIAFNDKNEPLPSWSWAGWTGGIHYRLVSNRTGRPWYDFDGFAVTCSGNVQVFHTFRDNDGRDLHEPKAKIVITSESRSELNCLPPNLANVDNMLIFWTASLPAERFTLQAVSPFVIQKYAHEDSISTLLLEIYDDAGRSCGLLFHSGLGIDGTFQYILISESVDGPLIDTLSDFADYVSPSRRVYNEYYRYQEVYTGTLNVMLIRWTEAGFAERVAIGQIHEHAWEEEKPLHRKIYLG